MLSSSSPPPSSVVGSQEAEKDTLSEAASVAAPAQQHNTLAPVAEHKSDYQCMAAVVVALSLFLC